MILIERYIHEVGRQLPAKNRSDIQLELRSSLEDALESRVDGEPTTADVVALLKEFGTPKEVAASYYPEGQYLIGPTLYPLFRMVVGIMLAVVFGAQLLALGIGFFFNPETMDPAQAAISLLNSIPVALGMVVLVVIILQRFDVQPELMDSEWDPHDLPQIDADEEPVKQGERIFSIIMTVVLLIMLLIFQERIVFVFSFGWETFTNPVIAQYILLISFSLLLGIGLDIYLLWKGRWDTASRLVKIATNLFSITILSLLVQGHIAWLAEQSASGFFEALRQLSGNIVEGSQIVGMQAFRLGFTVALIMVLIETAVMVVRLAVRLTVGSLKREPVVIRLKKG
ncbi:MAG: hypothetical protein GY943_38130 [Chloroflexi bacterium]|nr:hypothetical protein [Chloroflexota bacterium]